MTERGVTYIATKEVYLDEAIQSVRSLKRHHPELPVNIHVDPGLEPPASLFDDIEYVWNPSYDFGDSVITIDHARYGKQLFLDTDTYIDGDISPIFDALERHDIVAAHDPRRTGSTDHALTAEVADSFPQFNTGVLGFNWTRQSIEFVKRWQGLYQETLDQVNYNLNQPSFRYLAWQWDGRIGVLSPEYNWRIGNVANHVLYACGPVKIFHGRRDAWTLEELAEYANAVTDPRVINCNTWPPEVIVDGDRDIRQEVGFKLDRLKWKYQKDGAVGTIKGVVREVVG